MQNLFIILLSVGLVAACGWAVAMGARNRRLDQLLGAGRSQSRQLHERLAAVERRRSELEAVLSSMVEGVAAIDTEERLISLNRAAAQLLSLDPKRVIGRPIQEVVRNARLQALVAEALNPPTGQPPATSELTLRLNPNTTTDDRHLSAQAAPVRDADGKQVGAVVVLHDITRLRRLESVRRDFVANVSHEIKTPISAIKAAVETLAEDPSMPAGPRANFTGIIARQADRLDAIVEDLLSLTRLEQDESAVADDLEAHDVRPVIHAACETCHAKALEKSIEFDVETEPVAARVVPTLLEQALVNLIDNAIKYSPEATTVRITTKARGEQVVIDVADQGRGIEAEHLPRIFERFYRTDRARSRQLGGTGLGLSIVKHITETLGGKASVQSRIGQGSTFSLALTAAPLPPDPLPGSLPTPAQESAESS
ncbi:MAG: ATP-binding protein [Planctomycetota bacterium]